MSFPGRKSLVSFIFLISLSYLSDADPGIINVQADTLAASQHYALADSLYAAGNYEDAIVLFQKAASNFEQLKYWRRLADCFFGLSSTYLKKFQLDLAEEYANKILYECAPKIDEPGLHQGKAYYRLGGVATRKRESSKALIHYEKAIRAIKQKEDQHPFLFNVYQELGKEYYMQGEIDESLAALSTGLEISVAEYGEEDLNTAVCYNNLANIYFRARKEFIRARIYYEKAISIRLKRYGENHSSLISPYANIASLDIWLGNYEKSLFYSQKALQLVLNTFGSDHPYVGMLYINISESYRKQEKYDDAQVFLNKALNLSQTKNHPDIVGLSNIHAGLSKNYTFLENYEKAIQHAQIAISLSEDNGEDSNEVGAISYGALAFAILNQGDYREAIEVAKKVKSIFRNLYGVSHSQTAYQDENIGIAYQKLGQYDMAIAHYDSALYANSELLSDDSKINKTLSSILDPIVHLAGLAHKTDCLTEYYLSNGEDELLEQAIKHGQLTDSLIIILRSSHYNELDKISFSKRAAEAYEYGIKANFLKYNSTGAESYKKTMFSYAEKTKSNQLKNVVHSSLDIDYSGLANSLIEKEKLIKADIRHLQSRLDKAKLGYQSLDSVKIKTYKSKIFELSRSHEQLVNTLKTNYPDYFNLKINSQLASLQEVQNMLDEHSTLIEYFVGDSAIYTFVIDRDSLYVHQQRAIENLDEMIESLQTAIVDSDYESYIKNASTLYQLLIEPVKDKIAGNRLKIIPDGELWHVNFDMLLTSDQKETYKNLDYLIKDYVISYGYSADLMVHESQKLYLQTSNKGLLAFSFNKDEKGAEGDSIPLRTLRGIADDLPGSRAEIKAISSLVDGEYYYGNLADKVNFKKNAKDYSILHLALHGTLNEDYPMNSKLQFTSNKDSIDNGALYAYELYNMSLNAELAVLSACNTGAGRIAKGEGIMSMGRAFTYAGCKSIVLTQWAVPDETTPQIMKAFYQELKNGKPKDVALQQAKLEYLTKSSEPLSAPLYWGSFVLLGDSAVIDLHNDHKLLLYAIVGIVLILIIISVSIYRRRIAASIE
ncbi:MAG: CHAT domain-containing tetratricopeptide repeat protein [Reichenbachiella sp.]|uniref:CHAT domain-containing protein n=1 Tax=Reichenbachiella sp. TaxID=2184521 RepID=UPI0032636AB2